MSKNILNELNKKGFSKSKFNRNLKFEGFINFIKNIKIDNYERIKKGYSYDLFDDLNVENSNFIKTFSENILSENKWISDYVFLPRVLKIQVLKSVYSENVSKHPTRAMLWHRDADDLLNHLKILIPLNKIDQDNGMFSCADKKVCNIHSKLVDQNFINKLQNQNNEYRKSDKIRIEDATMRNNFKDNIYDFYGDLYDLLFIDTNKCYHKGGQVLKKTKERYLVIIIIGSITHSFNNYFQEKSLSLKQRIIKLFARAIRFLKKILLIFSGGIRNKPIIL